MIRHMTDLVRWCARGALELAGAYTNGEQEAIKDALASIEDRIEKEFR